MPLNRNGSPADELDDIVGGEENPAGSNPVSKNPDDPSGKQEGVEPDVQPETDEKRLTRQSDEELVNEDLKAVLYRMAKVEWGITIRKDDLKDLADKVWALLDTTCIDLNAQGRKTRLGLKLMTEEEVRKTLPKR